MKQRSKNIKFTLACNEPRAWLVLARDHRKPLVVEMREHEPSIKSACLDLSPGEYRCRYYCGDNRNFVYHGPAHTDCSTDTGMDALVSVTLSKNEEPANRQ